VGLGLLRPVLDEDSRNTSTDGIDGWDGRIITRGDERRCYTREVAPDEPRPRGAHSMTTHPNRAKSAAGWRLAWFLGILVALACPIVALLAGL